jgi:asparagine synthase (glutamine-hydrolysing)
MLMSDVPIGAFVSGGVDSSLISSIATRINPQLSLFTADVKGKYSEHEDAKFLAESLGRPLQTAAFEPEMMLTDWVSCTYHYETPIVSHTNAIPFARVAELARSSGTKTVLTGEGADELFLGYPKLLAKRYRRLLLLPVEFFKALYGIVPALRSYIFPDAGQSIEGFLCLLAQGFERQRYRERGWESYGFLSKNELPDHYLSIELLLEHLVSLLHRNDRMGMKSSIESRFPFLDETLVKFAINLPLRWKMRRVFRFHDYKHPFLIDKWPVRALAEVSLPDRISHKKKNGFPMIGHNHLRVTPGFFRGGYVADLVGLTPKAEEFMHRTQSPYLIAKLASLEVFGRLFERDEKQDRITDRVLEYCQIVSASKPQSVRPSLDLGRPSHSLGPTVR